jgi:hypothetical protein
VALERRRGFRPDHKSFGRFMLSEQARKPAIGFSEAIADLAALTARRETGDYAKSFKVNRKPLPIEVAGNLRAIAEVYNSDRAAVTEEFGNARQPNPQRTLGKAGARFHSPKAARG